MIGALINLVIVLVIVGVIFWAIQQLMPLLSIPEPIRRVIYVILVVILVIIVVYALLGLLDIGVGFPRLIR